MFWNTEEKIFEKWLMFALSSMVEHDRIYHNLLVNNLTSIESTGWKETEIDTSSNEYLCGKFLFRCFVKAFIVAAGCIEQKLSNSNFDKLQKVVTMISIEGSEEQSIGLDKIPLDALKPLHGRGAEFTDESQNAFMEYMTIFENIS